MSNAFRLTRAGCLAVHLMPTYRGVKLENAVKRIVKNGPRDKFEQGAVLHANQLDCGGDPPIKSTRSKR